MIRVLGMLLSKPLGRFTTIPDKFYNSLYLNENKHKIIFITWLFRQTHPSLYVIHTGFSHEPYQTSVIKRYSCWLYYIENKVSYVIKSVIQYMWQIVVCMGWKQIVQLRVVITNGSFGYFIISFYLIVEYSVSNIKPSDSRDCCHI